MRAAFGLAGLLVAIGGIVLLMSMYHPADTVRTGKKAEEQAQQFAGVGARESIKVEPRERGGRLYALHVDYLLRGGSMEKHYGLKRDDLIIRVGPIDVKDMDDAADGMNRLVDAYQKRFDLTV